MAEGRPKSRFFAHSVAVASAAIAHLAPRKINDMVRGSPSGTNQFNSSGNGSRPVAGGGAKERAKRLAKIRAGKLRAENGLASDAE